MAVAKVNQDLKRQKKREKKEAIERLTNRYMINLSWGIAGILIIRLLENRLMMLDNTLMTVLKVFAGIFAVLAVALFVCGIKKVLNNKSRWYHYTIFSAVLAVVSLWMSGYWVKIRSLVVSIVPGIAPIHSGWWCSWGPILGIIVYLAVALIWTAIRVAMIEKGKK